MNSQTTPTEQPLSAGVLMRKKNAIAYRTGLVLQAVGAGILAVLYPISHPFYTIGIMIFELGALIAGFNLIVWITWVKKIILGAIITGLFVQVIGLYFVAAENALTVALLGIGLVCFGTAGIAGKEAYCFALREGWVLMWLYPLVALMNLLGKMPRMFNAIMFSLHFLLLVSLVSRKMKQPLLSSSSTACSPTPEAQ
ncbi:MAG: DUF2301 domain-containing membrane protein [Nitrospirota bacterium]|nr:DUF2301 domain-containing membrane protein [Nitrospirota bacterium]